ncbi:tyrosine-type recombinase/integrase [Parasutterella excrementihominis]|jgi:integrase|uniref:tyrosine-type recombinase/integrase n=1 Tax=Parasutterella excrementihominis TaxID=487175 RepID=UPI00248BFBB6|nr:site-specific integrase [Parasutterella excrementihominis]
MPRIKKALTVKEVNALPDGRHAVGGVKGLTVEKRDGKITGYRLRYSKGGSEKVTTYLSTYTLSEVRKKAAADLALYESGTSPQEVRAKKKEEKAAEEREAEKRAESERMTFSHCAKEFISLYAQTVSKSANKARLVALAKHLAPVLGDKPIDAIMVQDVAAALEPIWVSKPNAAQKAYTLAHQVFNYAIAKELTELKSNPADLNGPLGVLLKPLARPPKENYPSLPFADIQAFIRDLLATPSASAYALFFAILTASRNSEVRLAEWKEFDLDNGVWTIPEEHQKTKDKAFERNRTKVLSAQAIDFLKHLPRIGPLVFIKRQDVGLNEPLSDMAMTGVIKALHEKKIQKDGLGWIDPNSIKRETGEKRRVTPHGFRATFRSWVESEEWKNYPKAQEAAERMLLHEKKDNLNGAYRRYGYDPEQKEVAQAWADYCLKGIDLSDYSPWRRCE